MAAYVLLIYPPVTFIHLLLIDYPVRKPSFGYVLNIKKTKKIIDELLEMWLGLSLGQPIQVNIYYKIPFKITVDYFKLIEILICTAIFCKVNVI